MKHFSIAFILCAACSTSVGPFDLPDLDAGAVAETDGAWLPPMAGQAGGDQAGGAGGPGVAGQGATANLQEGAGAPGQAGAGGQVAGGQEAPPVGPPEEPPGAGAGGAQGSAGAGGQGVAGGTAGQGGSGGLGCPAPPAPPASYPAPLRNPVSCDATCTIGSYFADWCGDGDDPQLQTYGGYVDAYVSDMPDVHLPNESCAMIQYPSGWTTSCRIYYQPFGGNAKIPAARGPRGWVRVVVSLRGSDAYCDLAC